MNRIDRLFSMITMLQSRKYVPAEKLAEKFNISTRTVYRDIKAIGEAGIPVSFEQTRGYFIVQGYFLPPVAFTEEEAGALLLMEPATYSFADRSIQKLYASALTKIKGVLKAAAKENIEILDNNIKFQTPERYVNDFEYLSQLQQAITSKTIIEVHYKNLKEEVSCRSVEPIGLIFYAFSWHLIGWCHVREDYRDFKVARILKIRSLEKPFSKPAHIELGEYMKELPVTW